MWQLALKVEHSIVNPKSITSQTQTQQKNRQNNPRKWADQPPNDQIHTDINVATQLPARVTGDNSEDQEGPTPQEIREREDTMRRHPLQPLQKRKPKRNNRTPIMIRLRVPLDHAT
jgi:hypothetical protein